MSDAGSYWRNWAGIELAISRQSMTVHSQLRPNTYYRWHFLSLLPSLVWFLLSMLCTFFLLLLRSTVPTSRAIKENETINVRMCVKGRNYFMIYGDLIFFKAYFWSWRPQSHFLQSNSIRHISFTHLVSI